MILTPRHERWHAPFALSRLGDIEWMNNYAADTTDEGWNLKIERALADAYPQARVLILCLPCMYSGGFDPTPIKPLGADQYWTRMIPETAARLSHAHQVESLAALVLGQSKLDLWFHAYLQATHEVPVVCLTLTKYKNPVMARILHEDTDIWPWLQRIVSGFTRTYINPFMHGKETQRLFDKLCSRLPGSDIRIMGGDPKAHSNWNNKIFVRKRAKEILGEEAVLPYATPTNFKDVARTLWDFLDRYDSVKLHLPDTGGSGGLRVFHREEKNEKSFKSLCSDLQKWLRTQNWTFTSPLLIEQWVLDSVQRDSTGRPFSLSSHAYINEGGPIVFRGTKLQLWYRQSEPQSGCSGGIGARFIVDNRTIQRIIELSNVVWTAMLADGVVGMASPDWIVLKDGRIVLVECNIRWSDTSSHDGVEMWMHPFDFMGDSLAQANEQLVIYGRKLEPRELIMHLTRAAKMDGLEKQISFRFVTPIYIGGTGDVEAQSKITVVISAASRNDLSPVERIRLVDDSRHFFQHVAKQLERK